MRHRRKRGGQGGFTLIEMMIVVAILAVFMAFVFTNIMNTRRIAAIEDVRLNMDGVANGVLRTVSFHLKEAVLPVHALGTCEYPESASVTGTAKFLNDKKTGFGTNAEDWESRLINGTNFLAFCTPIDADGTGDKLDGDMRPYLGITHPSALSFQSGGGTKSKNQITDAEYDANHKLLAGTNANPGLAELKPAFIQALNVPAERSLDWSKIPKGAYAIIRFVPLFLASGSPVIVHEGADTGGSERGLNCDINGDGRYDPIMRYYVGNIEIAYPAVKGTELESELDFDYTAASRRLGTMDMVAVPVQENRKQQGWGVPLFTLVSLDADGSFVDVDPDPNEHNDFVFDSMRVHLTLVNYHDRDNIRVGDPDHPGGSGDITQSKFHTPGSNVVSKQYEGIIRLRSM